jgi:hypothetical protein
MELAQAGIPGMWIKGAWGSEYFYAMLNREWNRNQYSPESGG